jgi:hypothetical protein
VVPAGPNLEEQFFAGVEERVIGNARVPMVSAKDLVAMKVLAGRSRAGPGRPDGLTSTRPIRPSSMRLASLLKAEQAFSVLARCSRGEEAWSIYIARSWQSCAPIASDRRNEEISEKL